jgi:Gram-negative bacterial TonB protein C-terminal
MARREASGVLERGNVRRVLGAIGCLTLIGSAAAGLGVMYPDPENGAVVHRAYENEYFGIRYPLPPGWTEDLKGPEPSVTGYYSLAALKPEGQMAGTIQISAQDDFFAPTPAPSASAFLAQMKRHLDASLSSPENVSEIDIAGRRFARVDYSGAGLDHAIFATEIRCHTVIFSITASRKETLDDAVRSLRSVSFSEDERPENPLRPDGSDRKWPRCVSESDYAPYITHREDAAMTGPRYGSVPVRLIIGVDGKIKHIHAIAGFPEQVKSVTDALARWEFKPYLANGRPIDVETGILFASPKAAPPRTGN